MSSTIPTVEVETDDGDERLVVHEATTAGLSMSRARTAATRKRRPHGESQSARGTKRDAKLLNISRSKRRRDSTNDDSMPAV